MRAQNIRVPLVLITASDDSALDRAAAAAGAVCLLRKPFSTDTLLSAVGCALGGSARPAALRRAGERPTYSNQRLVSGAVGPW
jgi:FixJ family two-component response regulator